MIIEKQNMQPQVKLIDFGLVTKYLDDKGKHIMKQSTEFFEGNFIFASVNALKFKKTSRRDDLLSLCYLVIFVLNHGRIPFISKLKDTADKNIVRE